METLDYSKLFRLRHVERNESNCHSPFEAVYFQILQEIYRITDSKRLITAREIHMASRFFFPVELVKSLLSPGGGCARRGSGLAGGRYRQTGNRQRSDRAWAGLAVVPAEGCG